MVVQFDFHDIVADMALRTWDMFVHEPGAVSPFNRGHTELSKAMRRSHTIFHVKTTDVGDNNGMTFS